MPYSYHIDVFSQNQRLSFHIFFLSYIDGKCISKLNIKKKYAVQKRLENVFKKMKIPCCTAYWISMWKEKTFHICVSIFLLQNTLWVLIFFQCSMQWIWSILSIDDRKRVLEKEIKKTAFLKQFNIIFACSFLLLLKQQEKFCYQKQNAISRRKNVWTCVGTNKWHIIKEWEKDMRFDNYSISIIFLIKC